MGQVTYRANLSSSVFPMTLADAGRAVIIPGPDQNYDRRVDPTGEQKNAGIPQAIFLQDVMPTPDGYQSVGYRRFTGDMAMAGEVVAKTVPVTCLGGSQLFVNYLYQGELLRQRSGTDGQSAVTGSSWNEFSTLSSCAVRGEAYLYASGVNRLYTVVGSSSTLAFTEITLTVTPLNFLTTANIKTILAFANYLIAISSDGTVYWSSTTTPTDFVVSLVSGSGSTQLSDLRGIYVTAEVCSKGFYIYSTEGALFAQYTGNARYPFKFTVVQNFSGLNLLSIIYTERKVAGGVTFSGNVVIDKFGAIKLIDGTTASPLNAEISSHLSHSTVRDNFSYATNTFTQIVSNTFSAGLFIWMDRYVFISVYDSENDVNSQFSHVIVYDFELKRIGKLAVTHKHVISFNTSQANRGPGIGFVDAVAGVIRYLNFDIYNSDISFMTCEDHVGVLALGKFQYARSRKIKLEEIEFEGPPNTSEGFIQATSCIILPCQDGRNFDAAITPYTAAGTTGGLSQYLCHNTAQNHTILVKGAFSLNTLQLKFTPAGGS